MQSGQQGETACPAGKGGVFRFGVLQGLLLLWKALVKGDM